MRAALISATCFLTICAMNAPPAALPQGARSPGNGAEETYTAKEVTKKATVLEKPEPGVNYPPDQDVCGSVKLRILLSSAGKVTDVSVLQELPDDISLKEKATRRSIEAARKIKFIPAQKDGRPVSQWVTIEYSFNLDCYHENDPVSQPVVILEKPAPEQTRGARAGGVSGVVKLRAIFTKRGKVLVDSVVEGLPHGLTEKAVEAARKIKFTPAQVKGRPVTQYQMVQYTFSTR